LERHLLSKDLTGKSQNHQIEVDHTIGPEYSVIGTNALFIGTITRDEKEEGQGQEDKKKIKIWTRRRSEHPQTGPQSERPSDE
jgi:hypothetical protein